MSNDFLAVFLQERDEGDTAEREETACLMCSSVPKGNEVNGRLWDSCSNKDNLPLLLSHFTPCISMENTCVPGFGLSSRFLVLSE